MVDKEIKTAVDEPKRPVGSKKSSKAIHDPMENKPETTAGKKMKTAKVDDAITKGRTMTGSKPDQIVINPVFEKLNANFETFVAISELDEIYNSVTANQTGGYTGAEPVSSNPNDSSSRFIGTNSITKIYRQATPGQDTDDMFALRFQDPKHDKEAITRSGQPRKKMDLVPRNDPKRDRHTDSDFFRQQSIVKRRVDEAKKTAWEKMLANNPRHAESERRAQEAKAGLQKANADYQSILDREAAAKKKVDEEYVDEISHNLVHSFTSGMLAKHPDAISPLKAKTARDRMRAASLQLAMDKDIPRSAIRKPHIAATEQTSKKLIQPPAGMNKMSDKEMYGEEVWDEPNPKKHHSTMTAAEKIRAKARAKAAGRPYPNLVDNMAAMKEDIDDMFTEFAGCPIDEESDVEGLVEYKFVSTGNELYEDWNEINEVAEHGGHKVHLNKPFLTPGGPKKRAVYVKNASGNVVKVNFGDPHLSIKRDQPTRRSSYRARHHCETPGPRWKANYWSCKYWSSTPTSTLDKG